MCFSTHIHIRLLLLRQRIITAIGKIKNQAQN